MSIEISFVHNTLVYKGRPVFLNSTCVNIRIDKGIEDRRHILHGATQITAILVESFNRIIQKKGRMALRIVINGLLKHLRDKGYDTMGHRSPILMKIKQVITIAFSKEQNLIAGFTFENQGIEKARNSIHVIRKKLDEYCVSDIRSFNEVKAKIIELIDASCANSGNGRVAKYRLWILATLKETIENSNDSVEIIRTLDAFEFSCTLDIVHNKTSKEQNIWGLTMAAKLKQAISNEEEENIYEVLF